MTNLDRQLIQAHFHLMRSFKNSMKPSSGIINLTFVQIHALLFLGERKEVTMSEFSKHFQISGPTATVLLDRLNYLKLIQRRSDKGDRRLIKASLSAKGRKLLTQAMRERETMLGRVFSKLSVKDKSEYLRILKNLSTN